MSPREALATFLSDPSFTEDPDQQAAALLMHLSNHGYVVVAKGDIVHAKVQAERAVAAFRFLEGKQP